MAFLRFLMLLALVVWVGGLVFFSFVEAPALFRLVPAHLAGLVVARSLTALHWMGMAAGAVFLASAAFASRGISKPALVVAMIALTAILQFGIMRRMEALRAAVPNGDISALAIQDPARQQFDRLHGYSTWFEGGVLLLGLITILLVARDRAE
ncbi:MAG: DUF4149 domain-containing protein [Acidobacteria bacterium]|nr:DUF4149 domain-containing protein [Acidobacteriota bacterium]